MTAADLRTRRASLGLTQQALADRLGVRHSTVWRWEYGKSPIPSWLVLALDGLALWLRQV